MPAREASSVGVDAPLSARARYKPSRSPRYTDTMSTAPSAASNSRPTSAPVMSSSVCSAWASPIPSSLVMFAPFRSDRSVFSQRLRLHCAGCDSGSSVSPSRCPKACSSKSTRYSTTFPSSIRHRCDLPHGQGSSGGGDAPQLAAVDAAAHHPRSYPVAPGDDVLERPLGSQGRRRTGSPYLRLERRQALSLHAKDHHILAFSLRSLHRVADRSSARARRPSNPRRMYLALIRNTIRLMPGASMILGAPSRRVSSSVYVTRHPPEAGVIS